MNDPVLSAYGRNAAAPSPVNRMMAEFAADFRDGVDINLGVGYVNERTMPRDAIRDAVDYVLGHPEEHRQPLNYGGPAGSPTLIDAVRRMRSRAIDSPGAQDYQVHVGASGTTSILAGLAAVIEPGIVITADPMYYIYINVLERAGFHVITVEEDSNGMLPKSLESCIAQLDSGVSDLRFIYAVTVNNPTCSVLTNERRQALTVIADRLSTELDRSIPIVFDTAYEGLIHDPAAPPPASTVGQSPNAYDLGTLSKIFAPALRIGYIAGPPGDLMNALVQYASDVGFSAPLLLQEVAARLIDNDLDAQQQAVCEGYREKARIVREALDTHLGSFIESIEGGRAGFYFYLTFNHIDTRESGEFFKLLTAGPGPRVIYIPGEHFVHPTGPNAEQAQRQLRLSYGFEETDRVVEAVRIMGEAARTVAEGAAVKRP